ncbi:MAG: metallophosphoesterase [Candidatus Woesearchaeota archaeon]
MLIGIISDTHDNISVLRRAVSEMKKRKISTIIHAGDLCAPITLNELKDFKLIFALGNVDGDVLLIKNRLNLMNGVFLGFGGVVNVENKSFAVFHGHYPFILDSLIKSQDFDYIITGHTHKKRNEKVGKTRIINPGCMYSTHENSFAILNLEKDAVEFIKL